MLLGIRSDDGFKPWVNGKLVDGQNVTRGLGIDTKRYKLKLHQGRNPILLRVIQRGVQTWRRLRLTDARGIPPKNCRV